MSGFGEGFYVVGLYDDGPALLTPTGAEAAEGKTLAGARHSVWWQYQPRGESSTPWYICRKDPGRPGVMIGRRATLRHPNAGPGGVDLAPERIELRIDGGAFPMTAGAHESTLSAIWPKGGTA